MSNDNPEPSIEAAQDELPRLHVETVQELELAFKASHERSMARRNRSRIGHLLMWLILNLVLAAIVVGAIYAIVRYS